MDEKAWIYIVGAILYYGYTAYQSMQKRKLEKERQAKLKEQREAEAYAQPRPVVVETPPQKKEEEQPEWRKILQDLLDEPKGNTQTPYYGEPKPMADPSPKQVFKEQKPPQRIFTSTLDKHPSAIQKSEIEQSDALESIFVEDYFDRTQPKDIIADFSFDDALDITQNEIGKEHLNIDLQGNPDEIKKLIVYGEIMRAPYID